MSRRAKSYFLIRGAAAVMFMVAATVMPSGVPAGIVCIAAGIIGVLTCIGVNAGGPGERAGSRHQQVRYDQTRAPQGDWPPYDPDKVVEGHLAD